jgi:hypothetical protein
MNPPRQAALPGFIYSRIHEPNDSGQRRTSEIPSKSWKQYYRKVSRIPQFGHLSLSDTNKYMTNDESVFASVDGKQDIFELVREGQSVFLLIPKPDGALFRLQIDLSRLSRGVDKEVHGDADFRYRGALKLPKP